MKEWKVVKLVKKINYAGIIKIHSVLKKAEAMADREWVKVWDMAEEIYQTRSHTAHVPASCFTHNHSDPGEESWWLYRVDKRDDFNEGEKHLSYGFDWVKPPEKPINIAIGKKFYLLIKRAEQCSKRRYVAWKFLEDAFNKVLGSPWKIKHSRQNDIYTIEIGGDVFRAALYFHPSGGRTWDIINRAIQLNNIKIEDK